MVEFITEYFGMLVGGTITGGLAGFFTWFWKRKSSKADYAKSIVDLYQDTLDDLKQRYEERYLFLKSEYDYKFSVMEAKMEAMEKGGNMWKNKYNELMKTFAAYKRAHK